MRRTQHLRGAAAAGPRNLLALLLAAGLLTSTLLPGAAGADDVQLQVRDQVAAGEKAAIRVVAEKEIEDVTIVLRRDDGKKVKLSTAIAAGEAKELTWKQEPGTHAYKGEATVQFAGGKESTLTLDFSVTVAGDVSIKVGRGGFSLEKKVVRFSANGPVVRAELEVRDGEGKVLGKVERKLSGKNSQGLYEVTWEAEPGAIGRVIVKAYNTGGAWARVEVVPFSIFIPHEEVVFASAKHNLRASERPKLDETLAKIKDAISRNAEISDLRLYIAGYTDTVGARDYNRKLSARRARSIGAYFKKKGLRVAIYFQGFGKEALAVDTPDNTDEEKNRRALYLLSNHTPEVQKNFPRSDWKRL